MYIMLCYIILYIYIYISREVFSFSNIYVMVSTYGKNGRWHYPALYYYCFFLFVFLQSTLGPGNSNFLVLLLVWHIYVCDLENDRKFRSRSHKKWLDLVLRSFEKIISNNSFRSQKNIRSWSDRKFIRSLMPWFLENVFLLWSDVVALTEKRNLTLEDNLIWISETSRLGWKKGFLLCCVSNFYLNFAGK